MGISHLSLKAKKSIVKSFKAHWKVIELNKEHCISIGRKMMFLNITDVQ